MLPLDILQTRVTGWRQAAWPVRGGLVLSATALLTIGWPAVIGAGYGVVVWSRLQSARARYVLVGLMAISSLLAQGAWTRWMVMGVFISKGATPIAEAVSPTPVTGQVAGVSNGTSTQTGQVLQVIDGAHLQVSIMDQAYTVALIGLTLTGDSGMQVPACFGQQAQQYLEGLVGHGQVQLATDGQLTDRDDYGQMLRYVTAADGSLVNRQMIDAGMAMVDGSAPAYEQQVAFMGAQEAAKAAGRGVWGSCITPTPSTAPTGTTTPTPAPLTTVVPTVSSVQPIIPTPTPTIKPKSSNQGGSTSPPTPTPTPTPSPTSSPIPTPSVDVTPTSG